MLRRMFLVFSVLAVSIAAMAEEPKPEKPDQQKEPGEPEADRGKGPKATKPPLLKRLQGVWVRPNHPFYFEVRGTKWFHYDEKVPFQPTGEGDIEFPKSKDYAIVKTTSGHTWWLFSAGENAVGTESFEPDGSLHPTADGRMFYRKDSIQPQREKR